MMRNARHVVPWVFVVIALLVAWRIVQVARTEGAAGSAPQRFMWQTVVPGPTASERERARMQALDVLSDEPLRGDAFALLARVAVDSGDPDALQAQQRAIRRAPRDPHARAWLIDHHLAAGEFPQAFEHVDAWLRLTPRFGPSLFPALAGLTATPAFADALATHLETRPGWRGGFMNALRQHADPAPMDRVYAAMHRQAGLDDGEFQWWLERMMREGRWNEAYARWAGTLDLSQQRLPAVYNGGFDTVPDGRGFDWRMARVSGVGLDFVREPHGDSRMAHARFFGRAVPQLGLEQPLLLAPGRYALSARMRTQGLRSSRALEWVVVCAGQSQALATLPVPSGTSDWRTDEVAFDVPAGHCPGLWLRMRNPAPTAGAQVVSGEAWLDDVAVKALPGTSPPAD